MVPGSVKCSVGRSLLTRAAVGSLFDARHAGRSLRLPPGAREAELADGFQVEAVVERLLARGRQREGQKDRGRDSVGPVLAPLDGAIHPAELGHIVSEKKAEKKGLDKIYLRPVDGRF